MASYTKGQLVWAKVKGYSWWPAEVNVEQNPNLSISPLGHPIICERRLWKRD